MQVFAMDLFFSLPRLRIRQCESIAFALFVGIFCFSAFAEKVLIYDEEKGIIFVDKEQLAGVSRKNKEAQKKLPSASIDAERPRALSNGKTIDASIQRGRHKDPPDVYFQSGLQYFKDDNFEDALKNFTRADSLDPQPKYVLWMGKTLRQLHKVDRLLFFMNRIVTIYPESDVADDALFEIAFCYQTNNDYERAIKAYTKLAEQYPFGTSFSNGESFRDLAHKQCQVMRAGIISSLKMLGYQGDDLESLYREFQKSSGLSVSGLGNMETIQAIKAAYDNFLKGEVAKTQRQERMNKYRPVGLSLCFILLINCGLILMLNRKIAARRKQIVALNQVLSDLSIGAL
jgi:tetratricopeptide (TPR) repeat protein